MFRSRITFYVNWVIGLIFFVIGSYNLGVSVKHQVATTFNQSPQYWFSSIIPFFFGIHLSLLFLKKRSFKMNLPLLLCVSVPCMLFSFYIPIAFTFASSYALIPFWMVKFNYYGYVSIVGGFTLTLSFIKNNLDL